MVFVFLSFTDIRVQAKKSLFSSHVYDELLRKRNMPIVYRALLFCNAYKCHVCVF